ncbi:hypothetical protein AMK59_8424 [Oryctes borbonicus]|uniref:FR47-like domain-containing protein n=1 Tax=Oryctes borbonicus TaxID=1629725 RepID=A0A0T6AVP8_9SCAR|nr:hypothetical protein AMK59_8424 [Oryctes borbonicus]
MNEDILQEISDGDLPLLSKLYANHQNEAPHVYSLLNTCIVWKKKKPNSNYLTFFGVNGDWLESGTFILLMQYACYDLFIFTLERDCKTLFESLTRTKTIDYTKRIIWYAIADRHTSTVVDALKELKPSFYQPIPGAFWVIEREKALQFKIECPDDVYIGKLNKSHVPLINCHWPHRFEGSEVYLGAFVELNNCYGVFLKSDDKLVSWVLKNHMGQLGILQTLSEHKRKGYGSLITKVLSKEIAEEGHHPLGTVVRGNVASETMFATLGFRCTDLCIYFESY